jgi:16S rRNA processing protein RimM
VKLDNPASVVLKRTHCLTLVRDGVEFEYEVLGAQAAGQRAFKLILKGIDNIDQAEELSGATVMISETALPPTAPDEFYYFQAFGCLVVTTTGLLLGTVEEVFSNGANDVWVVRGQSVEYLVPVIRDVVKVTDWSERRVVIEAVPGLLNGTAAAGKREEAETSEENT